ncbi:MAG: NAD(+)/NADH kinase [Pontiellaceae bacterium]
MKNIGIIINSKRDRSDTTLTLIKDLAKKYSLDLYTEEYDMKNALGANYITVDKFASTVDMVFALGGDGTVLYAASKLIGSNIPILGINLGSLGFLSEVNEIDLSSAINLINKKDFEIFNRQVLEASVIKNKKMSNSYYSLNDIVIGWGRSSRIITLKLFIDDEIVGVFTCDGMIISTPTGSTGHSLSNGGPILHSSLHGICISVICPHTLSTRPLVVPDSSKILIEVQRSAKELLLSVDGHECYTLSEGDQISINKSKESVSFARLPGYSYFNTLTNKLNWRGSVI